MSVRNKFIAALGAVGLVAAAAYAPAASADRVGFNISVGGPGYAFSAGTVGYGYYDYYDYWQPAPVIVEPYAPYYRPYRPYVAPVVVQPYPVYRPYRYYDGHRRYHGHGHRYHDDRGWRHRDYHHR